MTRGHQPPGPRSGRSLFLPPRDAPCSGEGSPEASRARGGEERCRSGGSGRGGRRGGGEAARGEGRPPHPPPRGAARPAREFLPGRLPGSRGGGRKGFPVQEAVPAATASSLTLRSPAPPSPPSPRRRAPAPPAADPRPPRPAPALPAPATLSAPPGPLIHSLAAGPARRERGGSGPGQGPWRGGPLRTSLPHLGAAAPLAPAAAFSARTALAPSRKWRGPGVLAEQPPPPPPPRRSASAAAAAA